jgi:hypothetical protein
MERERDRHAGFADLNCAATFGVAATSVRAGEFACGIVTEWPRRLRRLGERQEPRVEPERTGVRTRQQVTSLEFLSS